MITLDQLSKIQYPVKQNQILNKILPQILIIDDDPAILEELKDFLNFNYKVKALFNSSNAFEIASELRPDLIIMDMKMSPKTGFQLAYEFKSSLATKFIPIIAITGFHIEKEHTLMKKLSGIKRIMIKPFIFSYLFGEIDAALKGSKPH